MNACEVTILGRLYRVYGYEGEGWFEILKNVGKFDEPHLRHLPTLLQRDAVCLDVGANLGMYTLAMSHFCPAGRVYAFEPDESCFEALTQTVHANGCANVKLLPWVVGKNDARGRFVHDDQWASSSHFVPYQEGDFICQSIDSMNLPRADLIKIDAEGSEVEILAGAVNTIKQHNPIVIVEFNSFALVHYHNVLPRDALAQMRVILPDLAVYDKSGKPTALTDPEKFLRDNMLEHGFVDNLISQGDRKWPD